MAHLVMEETKNWRKLCVGLLYKKSVNIRIIYNLQACIKQVEVKNL